MKLTDIAFVCVPVLDFVACVIRQFTQLT